MFKKSNPQTDGLNQIIDTLQLELMTRDADSEEFAKITDQLRKLYDIRKDEKSSKTRISPDTALTTFAHLAGIAMIVEYERAAVVTSKAIGFVSKLR